MDSNHRRLDVGQVSCRWKTRLRCVASRSPRIRTEIPRDFSAVFYQTNSEPRQQGGLDSNQDCRFNRPACYRLHHFPIAYPRQESNLVCNLRKVECETGTLRG